MLHTSDGWTTWGQIRTLADDLDARLDAAGLHAGSRVGVVLGNRRDSVASVIAVLKGERTLVTLDSLRPPGRLADDLAAAAVGAVLAESKVWTDPEWSRAVNELAVPGWSIDEGLEVGRRSTGTHPSTPLAHGVAIEMSTSGTTGPPKRVPLTHNQIANSLGAALDHAAVSVGETPPWSGRIALITMPIVHISGMWALLQALVGARPIGMIERFTVAGWHELVRTHRPIVSGIPGASVGSLLDADIPAEDLSSLRAINAGTSTVDPDLVDAFYQRYRIPILIVYGATEFSGAVAGWTLRDFEAHWQDKRGSVGRAFPGVALGVVDEDGNELPVGSTGRLRVRSAQVGRSNDEWHLTSDLAHLDADGYLYINGRADDVIIRGGFKISPEVVVRALRSHEAVSDATVFGVADPRLGRVPQAAVEIRNGRDRPSPEDLRDHCREFLAPYEVPSAVHILDELPRGAALKVDRRRLLSELGIEPEASVAGVGVAVATSQAREGK